MAGFTPQQFAALAPTAIPAFKPTQIKSFSPEQAAGFTPQQLAAFTDKQEKSLPPAFVNALSPEQKQALTTGVLPPNPTTPRALKLVPVAAADSFDSLIDGGLIQQPVLRWQPFVAEPLALAATSPAAPEPGFDPWASSPLMAVSLPLH
ncbi:MAG: hypothetical protein FJ076_12295 [Cyanobacteria bacterium K_DeepCast_35m_m1_288]|nr:hypothetical protein [Cyanobacteria bacterium K_DeepCast_35m_m1_288]